MTRAREFAIDVNIANARASTVKGPKVDTLLIKIYDNVEAELAGFEAGEIGIIDSTLKSTKVDQYSTLPENESMVLASYMEFDMFEFDINNNETIRSYPGVIQPTNDPWFRTAMQYLVHKDYIVNEILNGYGVRIDNPVPIAQGDWYNSDVQHYGYDPTMAEVILDAHGYTLDPNSTYRTNPFTSREIDPLLFFIRSDDPLRMDAGLYYAAELEAAGIPVDIRPEPRTVCYDYVMIENDFNIYTGGWNLGSTPDYLYDLYYSSIPCGWGWLNYNSIDDPLLDQYLWQLIFAPDLATA